MTKLHIREDAWDESAKAELRMLAINSIGNGAPIIMPDDLPRPIRYEVADLLIHMGRIASRDNTLVWWNAAKTKGGVVFTPITTEL